MPKKKDTIETSLLTFDENEAPATEKNTLTVAELEQKIASYEAAQEQEFKASKQAFDEIEVIDERQAYRERILAQKTKQLEEAAEKLESVKVIVQESSMSKAVELAKELGQARKHFDDLSTEIEDLRKASYVALQDENTRKAELQESRKDNQARMSRLGEEAWKLTLEKIDLHNAQGQALYEQLERELSNLEAEYHQIHRNLEGAGRVDRAKRLQIIEKLATSINTLAPWGSLQSKIKQRDLYQDDSAIQALQLYIEYVNFCMENTQSINNSMPAYSSINELSIEANELSILSNGFMPESLKEKLEKAESYYKTLTKK